MANGLNKHHILEAIDKLRSRKSRPDAFRIVSYVSKKYEFPKSDIKDYLEMLSKNGTVLKVEFKGSFSYRNAANHRNVAVKTVSSANQEENSSHESISDLVTGALARLIVEEPDYLDVGISMNELYDHIDNKIKKTVTKTYFKEILQKEVKNGNLVKFENGNYCLGYPSGEHNSFSPSASDASQNSVDIRKEKSKSPILSIRKYSSLSRQSSPSSSKHSSSSEKTSISVSRPPQRTYAKKKAKEVHENFDEIDKNEVSPNRESRRKRFQKIVFDPSDSPKPKKLKDKKANANVATPSTKLRGPYKKQYKGIEVSPVKVVKKPSPASSRHTTRNSTSEAKRETVKQKDEAPTDEDSDDSSDSRSHCKICGFSIDFKSSRSIERWTSCHFCGKRAHVTCIEDTEQWTRFKLSKWQCNDCKSCVACQKKTKESGDAKLILCALCDDAYHYSCANLKKLTHKWFCNKCTVFKDGVLKSENKTEKDFGPADMTSNESSQQTTPEPEEKETFVKEESREKEPSVSQEEEEDLQADVDESIPDCSKWSCEEVYSYFSKYVLPEEATVFRDQEIDGKVLLLLTRYDVLSDFKLKLGPALKIYAQFCDPTADLVDQMTLCESYVQRHRFSVRKDQKSSLKCSRDSPLQSSKGTEAHSTTLC